MTVHEYRISLEVDKHSEISGDVAELCEHTKNH